MRVPDSIHGPYPEKTTRVLSATIVDETGAAIAGSSLTTLTWTLYDEDTLGVINSRSAVDCKASVDASGVLSLTLAPADMALTTSTKDEERHRILLEWTYGTLGAKRGSYEARILVSNVEKVT